MRELIDLLADGEFHPGDWLGEKLDISRAGVWKQIQKLQESGLDIQSVKGKGYRLSRPLEWLVAEDVRHLMTGDAKTLLGELDVLMQVSSTNDVAMKRAALASANGYVCLAEQQTEGRGRRGRTWASPFASNLYLSVVWEFLQGASQLEGLSLATGVAVAKALRALGLIDVRLKWPNDILYDEAKLGGILLEMTGDPAGRCQVVLGVGINHLISNWAAAQIDQAWTRVEDIVPGVGRNALAASVVAELLKMLRLFSVSGFAAFREEWQSLDCYRDRSVVIKTGAEDIPGIARGVDMSGGIRLETRSGIMVYKGGELSLRPVV